MDEGCFWGGRGEFVVVEGFGLVWEVVSLFWVYLGFFFVEFGEFRGRGWRVGLLRSRGLWFVF